MKFLNWIAEFFYPKELKEIIRTLDAEGNLRREPLGQYNKDGAFMMVAVTAMVIVNFLSGNFIESVCGCIFYYGIDRFHFKGEFKRFSAYCSGSPQTVLVTNIKFRFPLNVLITYETKETGIVNTIRLPSYLKRAKLLKGQELTFYCLDDGVGMPDIPIFKHHLCLRKDLMEDDG